MYKIIFISDVEDIIKWFIDWYKNKVLDTFTDTGLYYEDLIRENCINNSKRFKNEIFDKIEFILKEEIVWKTISNKNGLSIRIMVWNYRVFVEFSENKEERIRYVESIEFHKK